MLVAISVLALAATIVAVNAPPQRSSAQIEAERFAARLQLALETAVLSGAPMRLDIDEAGYVFSQYRDGEWAPSERRALAGERFLSPVAIDADALDPAYQNEKFLNTAFAEEEEKTHRILLDPLGAAAPFSVVIGGVGGFVVSLNAHGGVEVAKQ